MSVTSGFFNSLNQDRRYNAQQMTAIFDGIINDGIFANIGVAFAVSADTGVTINIGKGRAWFNSAWVYNDSLLSKTLEGSEVVLDRIDAVVIDVDHNESVRSGDIKIVKGTPSSSPKRPTMISEKNHTQHPLAYIYRKAGSTAITQADITSMIGTSSCPYITGILQVQNIDNIVAQWGAQWNQWYSEKIAETDADASVLLAEMKSEFEIWFADVQALLDDDVATALAGKVAELQGKFDTLALEGCVYDTIEDSDLDVILGSDGTPIEGKTMLSGGGGSTDALQRSGGEMRGPIDMKGNPLVGLDDPLLPDEAASKNYVDSGLAEMNDRFICGGGKNMIDTSVLKPATTDVTVTRNGESIEVSNTVEGTYLGADTFYTTKLKAGRKYIVSANILEYTGEGGRICIRLAKAIPELSLTKGRIIFYALVNAIGRVSSTVYTPLMDMEVFASIMSAGSISTIGSVKVSDIMLEEGTVATDFEPYYEGLAELSKRAVKTVWVNSAPSSSIVSNTTVPVPLGNELVFIKYRGVNVGSAYVVAGPFDTTSNNLYPTYYITTNGLIYRRGCVVTPTGVTFTRGESGTTSATENNDVMIPIEIYTVGKGAN